jgi:hypothetical protein
MKSLSIHTKSWDNQVMFSFFLDDHVNGIILDQAISDPNKQMVTFNKFHFPMNKLVPEQMGLARTA